MFEQLMQLLDRHDRYGPAVREAASRQSTFVLNYHTHGPGQDYCVSICEQVRTALPVFGQALPLTELAHIRGIGKSEEHCWPLMTALGEELRRHYDLDADPRIYLNGQPAKPPPTPPT